MSQPEYGASDAVWLWVAYAKPWKSPFKATLQQASGACVRVLSHLAILQKLKQLHEPRLGAHGLCGFCLNVKDCVAAQPRQVYAAWGQQQVVHPRMGRQQLEYTRRRKKGAPPIATSNLDPPSAPR